MQCTSLSEIILSDIIFRHRVSN